MIIWVIAGRLKEVFVILNILLLHVNFQLNVLGVGHNDNERINDMERRLFFLHIYVQCTYI
jgi:hypothetical protein